MTWNYRAPWWLMGGNLQTIYAAKIASRNNIKAKNWRRERWTSPDNDFIDVDWLSPNKASSKNDQPLLVLFHGLEGSAQSHYANAFAQVAMDKGWAIAIPHFRGCSGEINLAPRAYHSGDYEEIDWILRNFKNRHLGSIMAVGVSLGGNALMKWASEVGHAASKTVQAVASICSPIDLTASGNAIDSGFNKMIYARMFLKTMKPNAMQKLQQYPGLFNKEKLLAATTLYEFDDAFTAPLHGFKNTDDYWSKASSKPGLQAIKIPALVLNAKNDPFIPAKSLPNQSEVSSQVCLWQPDHGGHVGFTAGSFPGHLLAMPNAVIDWFKRG